MSRAPRSFDVDPEPDTPISTPRRPVALDVPPTFEPIDEMAAHRVEPDADEPLLPPATATRRFSFASVLFWTLGMLLTLGVGLAVDELIRELFARADWLGWLATGLAALAVLALGGIAIRELLGFRRLALIEELREAGRLAHASRDPRAARDVARSLLGLYADRPDMAAGRTQLEALVGQITDGDDIVRVAERDLITPLDARASRLALDAAKRVSVVTAVSPRAFIDLAFVAIENLRLIRRIADLYGGRPGTLGFWRLARNVIAHLAVTGSIAVGDSVIQQAVGHGLAARISSRLGEGVVNGLLTARVGIAAIDVCRPLPFITRPRPGIGDFVAELTRGRGTDEAESDAARGKSRTR